MTEPAVSAADTIRIVPREAGIARAPTAIAAFVGRALKGPIHDPILLGGFEDYRRVFGGLWQPSMLSYAVEQYFAHGGRECLVVRVCNGGRAPRLLLPAGPGQVLTLIGLAPGTREYLRASVDYDGIGAEEPDRFNLVVQRLRTPGSEQIETQEIFRRVSVRPQAEHCIDIALAESRLVRVADALPTSRPERSGGASPDQPIGYVCSEADGDDGDELTSYDIIGDAERGTGLFALRRAAVFNFLHIPPLARERDVGAAALLVALRLCRERQAMLLLDPPHDWTDPVSALAGLARWPFQSEDALMFYPRLLAHDRLRGREERFGCAASAAGLLAAGGERCPVWSAAADEPLVLRAGVRPECAISDLDRVRLAHGGVNVLLSAGSSTRGERSVRTLTAENSRDESSRHASARRFALFVARSIEAGTRWALCETPGPALWRELAAQVNEFFESLEAEGAFVGRNAEENWFVMCDERLNHAAQGVRLLIGFALSRPGEFQTWLITHQIVDSSVRPVSVNRYALPRPIESLGV